ncbi:TIM barrel protein [Chloroflexota bacterium]
MLKEALNDCLNCAKEEGVLLTLEPLNRYECNFINTILEGVAFIKEIGHPQMKILADTFHMNIEDGNLQESLKMAGPLLAHVHFADSNRQFPGTGHINFKEIIDTLKYIEYNGFVSGEMLPKPTEVDAMKGFIAFMQYS